MSSKTSTQIKQELDDLLGEDAVDAAPWTAAVKQRAINRAVRGSYPHFKTERKNETVTLVASTYIYSLSAITDIEEHGINRVYVEPLNTGSDYVPLRRVEQRLADGVWFLYVPEDIVAGYAGQKLRLHYYAAPIELLFTGVAADVLDVRFVNHVVYAACADLYEIGMLEGSVFDVDTLATLVPVRQQQAALELKNNTVFEQPRMVGFRVGG